MPVDFAQEYMGAPPVNPMDQYAMALRKKKAAATQGQSGPMHDLSGPSGIEQPPPVVQQPSLSPGVQAAAPAPQGQVGDSQWDSNFMMSKLGMDALAGEDQGLQEQGALIESLRGRKHSTGIGGAIGAAGDIVGTLAALKNQDKRAGVREKSLDEMRKSLFRNSATNGLPVDPTRDF
jgi:hypothetical protein